MSSTRVVMGDGPDVLLINGWRCPARAWGGLDRAVAAAGFRTTCLDPPNNVLAGGPRGVAGWLRGAIGELLPLRAIIGYSMGAQTAVLLAEHADAAPARLVLIAPLVVPIEGPDWLPTPARQAADVPIIAKMLVRAGISSVRRPPRRTDIGDRFEAVTPEFQRTSVPRLLTSVTRRIVTAPVRSSITGLANSMALDLRPRAAALRVPTLVVAGEHDTIGTAAGARELVDVLGTRARLLLVRGAGHFPHLEDPITTVPPILRHLEVT